MTRAEGIGWGGGRVGRGEEGGGGGVERREGRGKSEEGGDGEVGGPDGERETPGAEAEAGLPTGDGQWDGWGEKSREGAVTNHARRAAAKGCVSGRSAWR